MDTTQQILANYLKEQSTDYCLMLDGEWGIGKTYYWHNTLVPQIEETSIHGTERKYRQVTVSVFGITSVTELRNKLFKELFAPLNSKVATVTGHIFDSTLKVFGKDSFSTDDVLNLVSLYPVDLSGYVLCFDDLERLQDDLFIPVLGFINTLVEVQGIKVVLICYNKKCADKVHYKEYKEKLVRYTCKVWSSVGCILLGLAKNESDGYRDFLIANSGDISKLFGYAECCNVRTLKFIVQSFRIIYEHIWETIEERYRNDVGDYMLYIYVVYCLEYKKETRDIEMLRYLQNMSQGYISNIDFWGFASQNKKDTNEKTLENMKNDYLQEVRKRYFPSGFYFHGASRALIEYVFTGNPYIDTLKEEELAILRSIKGREDTKESQIMKRLTAFWDNEDDEMNDAVSEALENVGKAEYKMYVYPLMLLSVQKLKRFGFAEIEPSEEDLYKLFENAVDNCQQEHVDYNVYFHTDHDEHVTNEYKKLKEKVLGISRKVSETEDKKRFAGVLNTLGNDTDLDQFKNCFFPIFENVDPNEFLNQFLKCRNSQKRIVWGFFDERYNDHQMIRLDKDFLERFIPILDKNISNAKSSPSKVYCSKIRDKLQESLKLIGSGN